MLLYNFLNSKNYLKESSVIFILQTMDHILILLDRSGSMASMGNSPLLSINEYLQGLRHQDECMVTVYAFDSVIEIPIPECSSKSIPNIEYKQISPRGGTALLDTIYAGIIHMEQINTSKLRKIVIITDGEDTCSTRITDADILKNIIKDKSNKNLKNPISFLFLAANQDAISTAYKFGISQNDAITVGKGKIRQAMRCASSHLQREREGCYKPFTSLERQESGGGISPPKVSCQTKVSPQLSTRSISRSPPRSPLNLLFQKKISLCSNKKNDTNELLTSPPRNTSLSATLVADPPLLSTPPLDFDTLVSDTLLSTPTPLLSTPPLDFDTLVSDNLSTPTPLLVSDTLLSTPTQNY